MKYINEDKYLQTNRSNLLKVSMVEAKKLIIKCPHCSKLFDYYQSKFRPFCTERCRMIDLGQWLDETYRVPVKPTDKELEEIISAQEDLENEVE